MTSGHHIQMKHRIRLTAATGSKMSTNNEASACLISLSLTSRK